MEIEILCPFHGQSEKITLPSSYKAEGMNNGEEFKGEIPCSPVQGEKTIKLQIDILFFRGNTGYHIRGLSYSTK